MPNDFGNRITANALKADKAEELIQRALKYVETTHGYYPAEEKPLFSGVYYDSQKVGSYIVRVENSKKETAVLKLQLQPLPYDEGFIIREVQKKVHGRVRPVAVFYDKPWNENLNFGYLIFEDLSKIPDLWQSFPTKVTDREQHGYFLKTFREQLLPVEPWIKKPTVSLSVLVGEAFDHFFEIANKSAHHHIDNNEVDKYIEKYKQLIKKTDFIEMEFTHGHLSGKDVKYDQSTGQFFLMANLYWSWRPKYYDLVFPIWVDLMQLRQADLTFDEFLARINDWLVIWQKNFGSDLKLEVFWWLMLDRAMSTIMLDLGASEWLPPELAEKTALLKVWQKLFEWIVENKMTES
ncbi:MAG: hypothetical protein V1664_05570 [Candidatus Uhrbacteria bacterium]